MSHLRKLTHTVNADVNGRDGRHLMTPDRIAPQETHGPCLALASGALNLG
jgi:hypothetical protein